MLTENQLKEKISHVLASAKESPQKYIRLAWSSKNKVAMIKGEILPLKQILFVHADTDHPVPTIIESNGGSLHLLCRPKKHMAWLTSKDGGPISYQYLDLKNYLAWDSDVKTAGPYEEHPRPDLLICVAETNDKSTIVIAFVNGTYILQTMDNGYTATLYEVIQKLVAVCNPNRKEIDQYGQEAQAQF